MQDIDLTGVPETSQPRIRELFEAQQDDTTAPLQGTFTVGAELKVIFKDHGANVNPDGTANHEAIDCGTTEVAQRVGFDIMRKRVASFM